MVAKRIGFLSETFSFSCCCLEAHVFQSGGRPPILGRVQMTTSTVDIFIAFLVVPTLVRAVILVDSSIMHEQVA